MLYFTLDSIKVLLTSERLACKNSLASRKLSNCEIIPAMKLIRFLQAAKWNAVELKNHFYYFCISYFGIENLALWVYSVFFQWVYSKSIKKFEPTCTRI